MLLFAYILIISTRIFKILTFFYQVIILLNHNFSRKITYKKDTLNILIFNHNFSRKFTFKEVIVLNILKHTFDILSLNHYFSRKFNCQVFFQYKLQLLL